MRRRSSSAYPEIAPSHRVYRVDRRAGL